MYAVLNMLVGDLALPVGHASHQGSGAGIFPLQSQPLQMEMDSIKERLWTLANRDFNMTSSEERGSGYRSCSETLLSEKKVP